MKIEIEYNGSFATCKITNFMPVNSDSDEYALKTCSFKDADKMSQIMALGAFETIKADYKRNLNVEKLREIAKPRSEKEKRLVEERKIKRQKDGKQN